MGIKKVISYLLVAVLTVGFVLPTNIADAFEQFPRSLAWELMSQSGEARTDTNGDPYAIHYVQAGEIVTMQVTVRNRSRNRAAEVWYGVSDLLPEGSSYPNAHAIGLGTWAPMDHIPSFLDPSSFVINGNRFVYYDGEPINKGQLMTLNFQVKIKDNMPNGTYDLTASLVREFDEWGWRDNGKGQNHRYRSMLWKFVVGDQEPPVTIQKISIATSSGFERGVQDPNYDIRTGNGHYLFWEHDAKKLVYDGTTVYQGGDLDWRQSIAISENGLRYAYTLATSNTASNILVDGVEYTSGSYIKLRGLTNDGVPLYTTGPGIPDATKLYRGNSLLYAYDNGILATVFTPDGLHYMATLRHSTNERFTPMVVRDGVVQGTLLGTTGNIRMEPRVGHFIHIEYEGDYPNTTASLKFNNRSSPLWTSSGIVFAEVNTQGQWIATVRQGGKTKVIHGGSTVYEADSFAPTPRPYLSPRGDYLLDVGDKWLLNGVPQNLGNSVAHIEFDHDFLYVYSASAFSR